MERSADSERVPNRANAAGLRPRVSSAAVPVQVVVTDVHMSFGSMVGFMVKWAIASIPAFLILFILGLLAASLLITTCGLSLRSLLR
ncbi:MAG: hypothetical protein ACE15D_13750 [Candidatus Eisenbacteria bacterium]